MHISQDLQYHDVKYIIDRAYEQREVVRSRIQDYRLSEGYERFQKKKELQRHYTLYRMYQAQMRAMYEGYLGQINRQDSMSYFPRDAHA